MQDFPGENVKILRILYGIEIIDYDIIKLLILRSQCRELLSKSLMHCFRIFFASFIFAKHAKFHEKFCKIQKKIFAFFRWKPYFVYLYILTF